MNRDTLKILALALPVMVMAVLVGVHNYNRENGTLWRIPVTGYDPRDLLRGHYLTFRYDWNWNEASTQMCIGEECALCIQETTSYNPKVSIVPLEKARQCEGFIQGYSYGPGAFEIGAVEGYGLQRYYIPESEAERLERILWQGTQNSHKFDIGLRVSRTGQAFIEGMYIDDVSLEEWIKTGK